MTQRITIGSQEYEIDAHQVLETALGFYVGLRKVEKPVKESERLWREFVEQANTLPMAADYFQRMDMFADYIIQRVREEVLK